MNKKTMSFIIIAVGLIITLYTGFNYVAGKKMGDMGGIHNLMGSNNDMNWTLLLGVGVMVIGGVVFLSGKKNQI
jgi:LPXTG-motif cell wall-anchored protein